MNIPLDIAKTANELGRKNDLDFHPCMAVAYAILAERQHCADVADRFKSAWVATSGPYTIAKAILSGDA